MVATYPAATTGFGISGFNNVSALGISQLTGNISSGDLAIPIASAATYSTWPLENFTIRIGNENIFIASRSGLNLTASARGHDGTTAAVHSLADEVRVVESATYIEKVREEVVALQTEVGITGAQRFVRHDAISATEGFLRKTAAGTYSATKSNLGASVPPTADEDSGDGYAIGSIWIDTTNNRIYIAADVSAGAAVWLEITNIAGAVPSARNLTAGAGLTGGGDLSANRTFNVGQGDGITVVADAILVNQDFSPVWTGTHSFQDPKLFIVNGTDATKRVKFEVAGITGVDGTLAFAFSAARTLTFPDATDIVVARATTDTLTNKTLTATTNNVAAKSLHSATTVIDVSAATAPTAGQVLTAGGPTGATWQTLSANGGWTDAGTYVHLTNNNDSVAIGVAASSPVKLTIVGTAAMAGSASLITTSAVFISDTTNFTTAQTGDVYKVSLSGPTYTGSFTQTIPIAATWYIAAAPVAGTNTTITTPLTLWVDSGTSRFDGLVDFNGNNDPALGGGAAASFGTIGGSGPTVAAQNKWLKIKVDGVDAFIPVWV